MENYPKTLAELEARFGTEEACRAYLFALRWPEGFVCNRCRGTAYWLASRGRVVCSRCQHQTYVTAETIFQDSRKPLVMWFRAIWWVTSLKTGASALGLQRVLGLGSYKTAWTWLHKLRRVMVRPGRDRLSGRVEVDESYLGGREEGVRGRGLQKKALIAVAAEEDDAFAARQAPDDYVEEAADAGPEDKQGYQPEPFHWFKLACRRPSRPCPAAAGQSAGQP